MENQTVDKIIEALKGAGDALSPTVKHGWEILVRQSYVNGIELGILSLMLGAMTVVLLKIVKKSVSDSGGWDEPAPVLLSIVCCISGVLSIAFFCDAAAHFINPEYYAIQSLIPQPKR